MKVDYKFIFKLGIILFIIVSVSTLALSAVNYLTEEVIVQKNIELQTKARQNVLPDADRFEQVKEYTPLNDVTSDVYIAYKGESIVGYCINTTPNGYGGKIEMIVGVDSNFSVTGVNITSMSETAGLGANSTKPEFLDQYKGKIANISVVKTKSDNPNSVIALSGATITSNAVTEGVNLAISEAKNIKEVAK